MQITATSSSGGYLVLLRRAGFVGCSRKGPRLRTFLILTFAVDEIESRYSSGAFVFASNSEFTPGNGWERNF